MEAIVEDVREAFQSHYPNAILNEQSLFLPVFLIAAFFLVITVIVWTFTGKAPKPAEQEIALDSKDEPISSPMLKKVGSLQSERCSSDDLGKDDDAFSELAFVKDVREAEKRDYESKIDSLRREQLNTTDELLKAKQELTEKEHQIESLQQRLIHCKAMSDSSQADLLGENEVIRDDFRQRIERMTEEKQEMYKRHEEQLSLLREKHDKEINELQTRLTRSNENHAKDLAALESRLTERTKLHAEELEKAEQLVVDKTNEYYEKVKDLEELHKKKQLERQNEYAANLKTLEEHNASVLDQVNANHASAMEELQARHRVRVSELLSERGGAASAQGQLRVDLQTALITAESKEMTMKQEHELALKKQALDHTAETDALKIHHQQELEEGAAKVRALETELQREKQGLIAAETRHKAVVEEAADLKLHVARLEEELTAMQKTVSDLTRISAENEQAAKAEQARLEGLLKRAEADTAIVASEKSNVLVDLQAKTEAIAALRTQVEEHECAVTALKARHADDIDALNETHRGALAQQADVFEAKETTWRQKIADLLAEMEDLRKVHAQEVGALQDEHSTAVVRLTAQRRESERALVAEARDSAANVQAQHEKRVLELEESISGLEDDKAQLAADINATHAAHTTECKQLRRQYDSDILALKTAHAAEIEDLNHWHAETVDGLSAKLTAANSTADRLSATIAQKTENEAKMAGTIEDLHTTVAHLESETMKLNGEKNELIRQQMEQSAKLQSEMAKEKESLAKLRGLLEASEGQCTRLSQDIGEVRRINEQLAEQLHHSHVDYDDALRRHEAQCKELTEANADLEAEHKRTLESRDREAQRTLAQTVREWEDKVQELKDTHRLEMEEQQAQKSRQAQAHKVEIDSLTNTHNVQLGELRRQQEVSAALVRGECDELVEEVKVLTAQLRQKDVQTDQKLLEQKKHFTKDIIEMSAKYQKDLLATRQEAREKLDALADTVRAREALIAETENALAAARERIAEQEEEEAALRESNAALRATVADFDAVKDALQTEMAEKIREVQTETEKRVELVRQEEQQCIDSLDLQYRTLAQETAQQAREREEAIRLEAAESQTNALLQMEHKWRAKLVHVKREGEAVGAEVTRLCEQVSTLQAQIRQFRPTQRKATLVDKLAAENMELRELLAEYEVPGVPPPLSLTLTNTLSSSLQMSVAKAEPAEALQSTGNENSMNSGKVTPGETHSPSSTSTSSQRRKEQTLSLNDL
eukprot:GCRY01003394.1.p1 GENE.GCRY01003394.1~~GCRY01003394.1.p1  ORF type:complete len:1236 (-),score=487.85 GCRY01003394.1:288-3995(-)